MREGENHFGKILTVVDIDIYEEGIDQLMALDEDRFRASLDRVSGDQFSAWSADKKAAGKRGKEAVQKLRRFLSKIDDVKQEESKAKRYAQLVKALRKTLYKNGPSYDPILLAAVLDYIGEKSYYYHATFTMPEGSENFLPTKKPYYGSKGEDRGNRYLRFDFDVGNPAELYHLFN